MFAIKHVVEQRVTEAKEKELGVEMIMLKICRNFTWLPEKRKIISSVCFEDCKWVLRCSGFLDVPDSQMFQVALKIIIAERCVLNG